VDDVLARGGVKEIIAVARVADIIALIVDELIIAVTPLGYVVAVAVP
jgi:ribosome-interacting GTPase 1